MRPYARARIGRRHAAVAVMTVRTFCAHDASIASRSHGSALPYPPARFASASRRPHRVSTVSTARSIAPRSPGSASSTSSRAASPAPASVATAVASAAPLAASRADTATCAPASRYARTVASPRIPVPPVTTTARPPNTYRTVPPGAQTEARSDEVEQRFAHGGPSPRPSRAGPPRARVRYETSASRSAPSMDAMAILERIRSPQDLRGLGRDELTTLCAEIRRFTVDAVQRTGGHISSSLGATEVTVALHRMFDSPRDKLVWDTGHQAYVHKILTGRRERFDGLRQLGGISGFLVRTESEHDT